MSDKLCGSGSSLLMFDPLARQGGGGGRQRVEVVVFGVAVAVSVS